MAELVFSCIVALAALVMFALTVAAVRRYPPIGVGLACLLVVPLWEVPHPPPLVTFSDLSIYPSDVITLVLLMVGLLEAKQLQANLRGWLAAWVLFGALLATSLLRGVAAFGLGAAVNGARTPLYFLFAMTWAFAVRPDRLRLHAASLILGWALVLVAVYHGVRYGIGGASSWASASGDQAVQTGRVLVGNQAMALLLCAAISYLGPASTRKTRPQFAAVSALAFLGVVVVAQHRSVWGAGAMGMAAVLVWSKRRQARNRAFNLVVVGAWVVLVGWSSGLLGNLGSELIGSALDTRTYAWRSASWQVLISEAIARGPVTVIAGEPFGGGFLRQFDTGTWTVEGAHNWYVTVFLLLGILGLAVLGSLFIPALVKSRAVSGVWTFVLVAVGVYGWAYSIDWYLAPWLGAAMTVSLRVGQTEEMSVHETDCLANRQALRAGAGGLAFVPEVKNEGGRD